MKITLLLSAYFLHSFSLVSSQCSLFSVSDCRFGENEILTELPLPTVQDGSHLCQELCTNQDDCTHWRWSKGAHTCTLLAYSYLHLCETISSGMENNFNDCINQDSNTCDDFVPEDCTMFGNVVYEDHSLSDAHACQEYLKLLGSAINAEVFIFSENDMICYLLDSSEKTCDTLSGPRNPVVDGCQTTNSSTSTSPATSSTTSTSPTSVIASSSTSKTDSTTSTTMTSTPVECDDDWIDGSDVDLGCLFIDEETGVSHTQAQQLCQSMESHLVEIHTNQQLDFISAELNSKNSYYWTGATDSMSEGNWTWPESGNEVGEFYWCPQEDPNNDSEKNFSLLISFQSNSFCGIGVTDAFTIPKTICQK